MATHKKAAAKPSKTATKASTPAKKAAAPKKVVAGKGKDTASKKSVTVNKAAKPGAKKAATAAKSVKKAATPAKTAAGKTNSKNVKNTVSKANNKTQTKKPAAPAKKAVPAKKAAPVAKKAVPAKKAAPAKPVAKKAEVKKAPPAKVVAKKAAPAKPEAKKAIPAKPEAKKAAAPKIEAPAKKGAPVAKPQDSPVKGSTKDKAPGKNSKAPVKKVIVQTITHTSSRPMPNRQTIKEEKKPNVIIAHRRLENKSKTKDELSKTMVSYQPDTYRSILDEPQQQTGPVYRYSDDELNEFKELISGRLEAARKELVYLQGLITRKDEAGTEDTENRYMNMEDGSGAMEREQLAQLASRQIQFINHLEKALIRIENKTYGICRVTGKLIDKARLRAVPHATLSIEAKNTMTKR
jgi:RNA polymerase-binding transcription factor DksA